MDRISDLDLKRMVNGQPVVLNGLRHKANRFEKALAAELLNARQTIERLTRAAEAKETEPETRTA